MDDDNPAYRLGAWWGRQKGKWYTSRWFIGLVCFFVGAIFVTANSGGATAPDAAQTSQIESLNTQVETLQSQLDQAQSELNQASLDAATSQDQQTEVAPAPAKKEEHVTDGTYLVGTDITAGRYKGTVVGDNGYWQISTDANGSNILSNNNVSGPFYVQVKKGQYLEITGVELVKTK